MQPVFASSAKISPSAVPTYNQPPTITGCVPPEVAPGYPNAHFSLRRGTLSAVKPAAAVDSKRVLVIVTPQPFHSELFGLSDNGVAELVQNAVRGMMSGGALPNGFPDKYSARTCRWARLRSAACVFIAPVSSTCSMCSGVICFRTSRPG